MERALGGKGPRGLVEASEARVCSEFYLFYILLQLPVPGSKTDGK
jgi:hypothetical protein